MIMKLKIWKKKLQNKEYVLRTSFDHLVFPVLNFASHFVARTLDQIRRVIEKLYPETNYDTLDILEVTMKNLPKFLYYYRVTHDA